MEDEREEGETPLHAPMEGGIDMEVGASNFPAFRSSEVSNALP